MINLKEHAVFIEKLQMEMVPLSVAEKALEEITQNMETKLDDAMTLIQKSLLEINKTIDSNE
jgi:hypothetical protein